MSGNHVINTVLALRDDFSGGILKAAENAKKSGAQIDRSMLESTRKIVAWKNKLTGSMKDITKKAASWGASTAVSLGQSFLGMDETTSEFREASGKVQTAFQSMKLSTADAQASFEGFYRILGDTDTAAEASQLLSSLAQDSKDIPTWLHIAAGAAGKFGDSLPIEGLIESMNETQRVGKVTGVFADTLNWMSYSEDEMNARLEKTNDLGERNRIIMSTMLGLYNDSAHAFYKNNSAMMDMRSAEMKLQQAMSDLGNSSASIKVKLLEALGLDASSGQAAFREGSFFDLAQIRMERFVEWLDTADLSGWVDKFDMAVQTGFAKVGAAFDWVRNHTTQLKAALGGMAAAFGVVKIVGFVKSFATAVKDIKNFILLVSRLKSVGMIVNGVKAAFAAVGAALGTIGAPAVAVIAILTSLSLLAVAIYTNWHGLGTKFKKIMTSLKTGTFSAIKAIKKTFSSFFTWISKKFKNSKLGTLLSKLSQIGSGSLFGGGSDSDTGPGRNALGTSYWRGGLTRVHERGGEIMRLPSGTQIIPHDVSKRAAASPSINVSVTVQGNVIGNRAYARLLGNEIAGEIMRKMENLA